MANDNTLNPFDQGAVLVEHSDERLAAVEEAKRTGQEFQSVGSKGHDIVSREVLRAEVERISNEGSSDPDTALPDYLVELKQGVEDEAELNLRKATEHHEYSAELAQAQLDAEVRDREKLHQDPFYFARRIAENNIRLAQDHSEVSAAYAEHLIEVNEGAAQETRPVRLANLNEQDPVTALGKRSKVTDISESAAADSLRTKDAIIYGEQSYQQQAKSDRKEATKAAGEDRAQKASKTDEPKRIDEPVRKQRVDKRERIQNNPPAEETSRDPEASTQPEG